MAEHRASTLIADQPALEPFPVPELVDEAAPTDRPRPGSSAAASTSPVTDAGDPTRARLIQRLLEVVPGMVSWLLILSPLVLSFRFPAIVAWFVLIFDFYWLYKAVVLTGSVCVTFGRMRRTMAADWRVRAASLADPSARLAEIERLVPLVRMRIDGS